MPARRGSQKPRGTLLQAHSRHAEAWGRPWLRHPRGASPGRRGPLRPRPRKHVRSRGAAGVRGAGVQTPRPGPRGEHVCGGDSGSSPARGVWSTSCNPEMRGQTLPHVKGSPREQRQGGAGHRRPGIWSWVGVPCRPWEPTGVSLMHSGAASEGSPHPRLCPGADCAAASPTRTGGRACCLVGLTCRSAASALLEDGTFGFVVYLMLLDST